MACQNYLKLSNVSHAMAKSWSVPPATLLAAFRQTLHAVEQERRRLSSMRQDIGAVSEHIAIKVLDKEFGPTYHVEHEGIHGIDRLSMTEDGRAIVAEVKGTAFGTSGFKTSTKSTRAGKQMGPSWIEADPRIQEAGLAAADVEQVGIRIYLAEGSYQVHHRGHDGSWLPAIKRPIPEDYWP